MLNVYTLNLPKQMMDVLLAAVVELPYRVSKPVVDEMMAQFGAQEQASIAQQQTDAKTVAEALKQADPGPA